MKLKHILLIIGLALLLVIWYFRTWFQGLALYFYATPVIWQVLILTFTLHYGVFKQIPALNKKQEIKIDQNNAEEVTAAGLISFFLFFLLLIPGLITANIARGVHLAQTVDYQFRDTLPESTDDIRLMPYHVAKRYAKDSLQLSQFKLGTENIALIDGKLQWVFPLTPDGLVITFLQKNKGIVTVDATTEEKNSRHYWEDMEIGEGMQIRDNLYWNLYRRHFFVSTDDPFYLPHNDTIYTVVGTIGYRFHFRWGVIYTSPYFKGVYIVDAAGNSEFVLSEAATNHPVLAGNRIFPENLTRTFVNAYQYHLGALNKIFIHKDQIQIQDTPSPGSSVNRQPYLMNTEEGLKWFISTEPYGASHGIFKIFVVDARTGQIEIYELPQDQTLTGPVRSVDYIRRSNPVVDWSRFNSVEPLPFVRNQSLFWKLTVIPSDAAGIAYQAFIDANTNEVFELRQPADIQAFLVGNEVVQPRLAARADDDVINTIRAKLKELEQLLDQLDEK